MIQTPGSVQAPSHFAIGDIHGCASELRLLLNKLPLTPDSTVVFLGDYIDRGPQSKEVVDTILELRQTCHVVTLKGNHEDLLLSFLENPRSQKAGQFIFNGGSATLASYSDSQGDWSMPPAHLEFFKQLQLNYLWDRYIFVHANVPDVPYEGFVPQKHAESLMWSRQAFSSREHPWALTVVHGHTPIRQPYISNTNINLDTGCAYSHLLTAMEFPSQRLYSVARLATPQLVYLRDKDSRRAATRYAGQIPVYVDVGNVRLDFETINYNEFGLLLRSCSYSDTAWFKVGQVIQGYLGSDAHTLLKFTGTVMRADQIDGEYQYGIRSTEPLQIADADGFLPITL
jgi:serine/threonine protein phosphatase 1